MNSSIPLAERQAAFMRALLNEDAAMPEGWGNRQALGMSVYRGNYRSALIGALKSTYERTAGYVGEESFTKACAHHAITHPPAGWTIDEAGDGFDATCSDLFPNNPEVADLAWLEWAMTKVATGPDCEPLNPEDLAAKTAAFGDEDWMSLRFVIQPRLEARINSTNLAGLWKSLSENSNEERPDPRLKAPRGCIVSREGERPVFQAVDPVDAQALAAIQGGASFGEMIALLAGEDPAPAAIEAAATKAGALLGEWLQEGWITGLET